MVDILADLAYDYQALFKRCFPGWECRAIGVSAERRMQNRELENALESLAVDQVLDDADKTFSMRSPVKKGIIYPLSYAGQRLKGEFHIFADGVPGRQLYSGIIYSLHCDSRKAEMTLTHMRRL